MNVDWLQTFILIVDKKSLTKAARTLHLTQPAVSKQLNSLEKFYGTPLLYRTSRYMEVTEAGKLVYEYSQKILTALRESLTDVEALEHNLRGSLLLGASTIPGEYILPTALGRFQDLHPQVNAKLEIADSTEVAGLVLDGAVEAGMIGVALADPTLSEELIFQDELVVIASHQHPFAGKKTITLDDYLEEPQIVREAGSGTRLVIENKLMERGTSPEKLKIRLELGSTEAVVNAVAAGLGISLVSHFAVRNRVKAGEISSVLIEDLPIERGLYFITRRDRALSPVMETFYCFLKDYLHPTLNGSPTP